METDTVYMKTEMLELVKQHGRASWEVVAEKLGTERKAGAVQQK